MKTKFDVGRCCCEPSPCVVLGDTFTRADTHPSNHNAADTLGEGWGSQAVWAIRGNKVVNLRTIEAEQHIGSYAVTEGLTPPAPQTARGYVAVAAKAETEGETLQVVAFDDDENGRTYVGGELTVGASGGTLRIFQVVDGTRTNLGRSVPVATAFLDAAHSLELCFHPEGEDSPGTPGTEETTGQHLCSTQVDGGGGEPWTNMSGVETCDSVGYAQVVLAGVADTSGSLILSDWGFAVPAGATIDGIRVHITHKSIWDGLDIPALVRDGTVEVGDATGGPTSANQASASNWTYAQETFTYGGPTNTLSPSAPWTATDINSVNFYVAIVVNEVAGSAGQITAMIDCVTVEVFYTTGGTPGSTSSTRVRFNVTTAAGEKVGYCQDADPIFWTDEAHLVGFGSNNLDNGYATGPDTSKAAEFDNFNYEVLQHDEAPQCSSCELECVLYTDDFARASVGVKWTQVSGTWAIASDRLQAPAAASGALIILEVPTPECGGIGHYVQTIARGTATGDRLRLVADYTDDGEYHFVEITFGSENGGADGTMKIGTSSGGSDTILHSETAAGAAINTDVTLSLCFDEGLVVGTVTAGAVETQEEVASTPFGGDRGGLGATASGTATFDDFLFEQTFREGQESCRHCGSCSTCTFCEEDCATTFLKVRISGAGALCDYFNGTHILPFVSDGGETDPFLDHSCCLYSKAIGAGPILINAGFCTPFADASARHLVVSLRDGSVFHTYRYIFSGDEIENGKVDCRLISDQNTPFYRRDADTFCFLHNAVVEVSAI